MSSLLTVEPFPLNQENGSFVSSSSTHHHTDHHFVKKGDSSSDLVNSKSHHIYVPPLDSPKHLSGKSIDLFVDLEECEMIDIGMSHPMADIGMKEQEATEQLVEIEIQKTKSQNDLVSDGSNGSPHLKVLQKMLDQVNKLEKDYQDSVAIKYQGILPYFLSIFEYANINHDNFFNIFCLINQPSPEQVEMMEDYLKATDSTLKLTNSLFPSIFNVARFFGMCKLWKDLQKIKRTYYQNYQSSGSNAINQTSFSKEESEKISEIQEVIDRLNRIIKDERVKAVKTPLKLGKLMSLVCRAPLEKFAEISSKKSSKICKSLYTIFKSIYEMYLLGNVNAQQKELVHHLQPRIQVNIDCPINPDSQNLKKNFRNFVISLIKCKNLDEIKTKLQKIGITTLELSSLQQWRELLNDKRFIGQLGKIYSYYLNAPHLIDSDQIHSHLRLRRIKHDKQVELSLPSILSHIHKCKELEFSEIQSYFKRLHIQLDQVTIADPAHPGAPLSFSPTTKKEWEDCIQNMQFCKALSEQWVSHHETLAQLSMQALQQALLSKHHVESKFLFFRGIEYIVNIAFSIIQLTLSLPKAMLSAVAKAILELFFIDLVKMNPVIRLIHLFNLYPDVNFKVGNILMAIVEHFFAIIYKPNEYSFEGYRIATHCRMHEFTRLIYTLLYYLEKSLLWFKIKLFGKKPVNGQEDHRIVELDAKYQEKYDSCQKNISKLKNRLNQLRVEDAKFNIYPSYKQKGSDGRPKVDPIQVISETLEGADFDCFHVDMHEFVEENFGIKLNEENKGAMQGKLEKFFSSTENKFIVSHHDNRFGYLRV